MYIKSIEIDGFWGGNLEDTMKQMLETKRLHHAEEVWCTFNTHRIDTNMTMDEAYLKVVGKTKAQLDEDQRLWREEYDRKEKEFQDSIPELTKSYIEKARGIIADEKLEEWDRIVPYRLEDLYHGFELDCTLKLVKMLDVDNCTLEDAKKELDNQGHSGMSYGLECSMLKHFCRRADEFLAYIGR